MFLEGERICRNNRYMVDIVGIGAFVIAVLMLYRTYDEIVQRIIYQIYTPQIRVNVNSSVHKGGSVEEYQTGFEAGVKAEKYNIKKLDPEQAWGMLVVTISIQSLEERDIQVVLEILTESFMSLWFEQVRKAGEYIDFKIHEEGAKRRFEIEERVVHGPQGSYPLIQLSLPVHAENAIRKIPIDTSVDVTIDASEFRIPFTNHPLPPSIGEVQFAPIEHTFDILGPAHEDETQFSVVEVDS